MVRLPSPAVAVALVAVGCLLGGTAVAGTGLITGAQIKDHSIGLNDLAPSAVARLRGQRGPQGVAGVQGQTGAAGAPGGFNPASVRIAIGDPITVAPGQVLSATVACPSGTVALGGGGFSSIAKLILSAPGANGVAGWTISIYNDTSVLITSARAYVVCGGP